MTTLLQTVIVLNLLCLDFVPLGRWNQLDAKTARHRRLEATLNYAPLLLMAWAAGQPGRGPAWGVLIGSLLYLAGHLNAWWRPYLFGTSARERADFERHFAGTVSVLPRRHGVAPDAAHLIVGALTLLMTVLAALALLRAEGRPPTTPTSPPSPAPAPRALRAAAPPSRPSPHRRR